MDCIFNVNAVRYGYTKLSCIVKVKLNMHVENPNEPKPPDSQINWSIYFLATALMTLFWGGFVPLGFLPHLPGGAGFWVGIGLGGITGLIVNRVRPRYERTTGRWRSFYDFLLKQLPPVD
jgi:hypothetical protein